MAEAGAWRHTAAAQAPPASQALQSQAGPAATRPAAGSAERAFLDLVRAALALLEQRGVSKAEAVAAMKMKPKIGDAGRAAWVARGPAALAEEVCRRLGR